MHKMTRRQVIAMIPSSTVLLCPAILNAQTEIDTDWADIPRDTPIGHNSLIEVPAGPAEIEISALLPGEVTVIARPSEDETYASTGMIQYVAVHHRTAEQIAFGQANDRAGTVQNPAYFVTNLVCSHRGKAVGITGNPSAPFACTDRGGRHSSVYDAAGFGVSGASKDEYLSIPDYQLSVSGDTVVIALA
ncbi:hypothetical protein SAMN04488005_3256 [Yoonia tamlensis]|uniref:Rieske domain-containing protein n=1 Tax=Yoonia tamlensis TaxID=390270 RepID=A0A1I6I3U8_9RHOB|nr:hypothetical protein [Yoonia tamlensis]SFR61318.1 hypothetical protein SAMN04488005_3256 [Yoonia tamlensis]